MANKELRINLTGDSTDLNLALSDAQKKLVAFSGRMKDIGKTLSISLTAPLTLVGTAAIKMASDLNESLNKVDVAFKQSSADVRAFAKTSMTSFGIAEGSALDMAAMFGDMATSMGLTTSQAAMMSKSLVGLAGDLASFKNISVDVAQTALSGIFTGETESLKRLGIVMTEQNVQYFLMEKGIKKTFEQMSQAEKTLARYQYIMAMTTNAQGDFVRTQDGAANQMRIFQEGLKQLGEQFGQIILPAFTKIVSALNTFIKYISQADAGTKTFILAISGIAAISGPLLFLAGTVIPKVIVGINLMKVAFSNLGRTVKAAGIIGLISAVAGAAMDQQSALDGANSSLTKLTDEEKTSATAIYEKNKQLYASIKAYEELRKSAAQQDAIYKAQTNIDRNTAKAYEQKIAQARALILENRKLLKTLPKETANPKTPTASLDVSPTGLGDTQNEVYGILGDLISLGEKIDEHRQKTRELKNELLAIRWPDLGKPMDSLTYGMDKALEGFKTPMAVMNAQIAANTKLQQENLQALSIAYTQAVDQATAMAEGVSSAFGVLGESIMLSFGKAESGLDRFLQGMARTAIQLAQMVLKEIIMNKALATSNAIAGATKSGAATGPAAVFTTPAFIATAVGGVLSAFAAIPKFAAGGIVSGPTMGLMGEYPGAKSNPEVIAPLNKLQSMIDTGSGGNMNLSGEFVVRGSDLVLALQRAERQKSRIG